MPSSSSLPLAFLPLAKNFWSWPCQYCFPSISPQVSRQTAPRHAGFRSSLLALPLDGLQPAAIR